MHVSSYIGLNEVLHMGYDFHKLYHMQFVYFQIDPSL